jgi:hypothetical protein
MRKVSSIAAVFFAIAWLAGFTGYPQQPHEEAPSDSGSKANVDLLDKLSEAFNFQRDAIITARIKFKMMFTGRTAKLSPDQVRQLIDGLPLRSLTDELQKVSDQLIEHNPGTDHFPLVSGELIVDGKKLAERYSDPNLKMHEATVDGDKLILRNPKNHQITASVHSSYSPITIGQLRFVPPKLDLRSAGWTVPERSAGRVTLKLGPNYMEVDESTGFVYRFMQTGDTGVVRETWQLAPAHYAGDIVFPSASVTCYYNNQQLKTLFLAVVEDPVFNHDQSADSFQVAVQKGDVIVDEAKDPNSPNVFRASEPNASVLAVIDEADRARRAQIAAELALSPGPSIWRNLMLCITIAVLIVAAYLLWRRNRLRLSIGSNC